MASGKPDWNRAVTMQGKYDSTWLPILVDATGQMYIALTGQQIGVSNLPSDYFKAGQAVGSISNNVTVDQSDSNRVVSGSVAVPAGLDVNNLPSDYFKDGGNVVASGNVDVDNLPSDYFKSGEAVGSITNNVTVDQSDSDRVMKGTEGANKRYIAVDATGVMLARLKGAYGGSLYDVAVDANGVMLARLKGAYGGSLYDVAVDASGKMIARLQGLNGATLRDVYVDSSGKMVARIQGVGAGDEQVFMIDDGGDTTTITDWVESDDAENPVDTEDYVKEGTHAMKLGIDASASGNDYAIWTKTTSLGDLTAYQHDWVYIWLFIPDKTYILNDTNCIQYYIGSSASDYEYFNVAYADISVGWNLIKLDLDNADVSIGTVDWTAIDFQRFTVQCVVGNTHDFYVVMDSINVVRPNVSAGTLFDVATDKDGLMLSKMVGNYADLVKPIGADRFGNMRVNIANQDREPICFAPNYGTPYCEQGTNTDNADEDINLFTPVSGKGIVLSVDIESTGATAASWDSIFSLKLDGVVLQAMSLYDIYYYRTLSRKDGYWDLTEYASPDFAIRLIDRFTFQSSFTIWYEKAPGVHTTHWRVCYSLY